MSNVGCLDDALRALLRDVVRDELPAALREVLAPLVKERGAAQAQTLTAGADELLTVGQVAAALQVTRPTVRRWIAAGVLRAHAVGPRRLVRVLRMDLERLVSSNRGGGSHASIPPSDLDAQAAKIVNQKRARRA